MIRSQWDKFKQGLNIGFIRAADRLVEDIERCEIAEPAMNEQIKQVRFNPRQKAGSSGYASRPEGWEVPRIRFFKTTSPCCRGWSRWRGGFFATAGRDTWRMCIAGWASSASN